MTLRIHEQGLEELAEHTRQWMLDTATSNEAVKRHCQKLGDKIALEGEFKIENPRVVTFSAPRVKFMPSKNSLMYISTDGGNAEVKALWSMESRILSLIKIQNVTGHAQGRLNGLVSDMSVTIDDKNAFVLHQCVARFEDFQLQLMGSLAADILHWFNRPLAKALQSRVEETFCELMAELLLPWLRSQLERFPSKLQMEFSNEIRLTQSLKRIETSEGFIDLQMTNLLRTIHGNRILENVEEEPPPASLTAIDDDDSDFKKIGTEEKTGKKPKIELFICEKTLQYLLYASHRSNLFVTNFTSPFLTTKCTLFCIGKLVPQIRSLPVISLFAVIRTNQAPIVHLMEQRIRLGTNVSFEIYDEAFQNYVMRNMVADAAGEGTEVFAEASKDADPMHVVVSGAENAIGDSATIPLEDYTELERAHRKQEKMWWTKNLVQRRLVGPGGGTMDGTEDDLNGSGDTSEEQGTEDNAYSFVTPTPDGEEEAGGSFHKIAPWKGPSEGGKQQLSRPTSTSKLIPHGRPRPPDPIIDGSKEWGFGQGQQTLGPSGGAVIWPPPKPSPETPLTTRRAITTSPHLWTWTLPPSLINFTQTWTAAPTEEEPISTTPELQTITSESGIAGVNPPPGSVQTLYLKVGKPILRIEIQSEVELAINLQNRRIHSEIKVSDVRARLSDSQIKEMSQRTIDLIVDTSVPFLENSVRIFYRDGIVLDELFQLPVKNATIRIRERFIQLKADFNLSDVFQ